MFGKYKENLIFFISLVTSIFSYYLICRLLKGNSMFIADISSYAGYFADSSFLKPEPFEKFCFLFGLIYVPIVFVVLYKLVYIFKGAEAGFECWIFKITLNYYWLRFALILFILLMLFHKKFSNINSKAFFITGVLIILATTITQFHTNNIIIRNPFINAHFSMIAGAVNQAANGKTILVDMFSQYGVLYPYIGAIFTKIFGHSILNISIYFLVLIFLSFLFMYMALNEKLGADSWYSLLSLI